MPYGYDNELGRCVATPGLERGHWYVHSDGSLFIVPDEAYGGAEIEGPDDERLDRLNAIYREQAFGDSMRRAGTTTRDDDEWASGAGKAEQDGHRLKEVQMGGIQHFEVKRGVGGAFEVKEVSAADAQAAADAHNAPEAVAKREAELRALIRIGLRARVENGLHETLVPVKVVLVNEEGFSVERKGRKTFSRWENASFVQHDGQPPTLFDSSHSYTHVI